MKRRSFIHRCAVLGATLGVAGREVSGQSQEISNSPFGTAATSGTAMAGGKNGDALTYLGSFPTPTLTDNYVKPNKTARINFGKHTKLSYCPANGLIYTCGGDGQGQHWGGNDSGTMDTVGTYNVTTHTYAEDFLYRGYTGGPTPRGLDFIAFTWSTSLKEFWLGPGYCWNYAKQYPWLDTSWKCSNYASYNPATKRFTDRGLKTGAVYGEGFAGSWDTKRDKLIWFDGVLKSLDPVTNIVTAARVSGQPVSSHRIETADTWYDLDSDELYFVQLATGKVYACHVGNRTLRMVADAGITASNAASYAVVYITDSKHCLIVYNQEVGGTLPWKLVNLSTGAVQHLRLFAPGCTNHNTGAYHPPTKTIVLTGGSSEVNMANGAAFHHYRSNL